MKKLILLLLFIPLVSFGQEILDNSSIIQLTNLELGDDVVISKIKSSQSNSFDVTVDALIELKENGVSSKVIALMIDLSNEVKSGIFFYDSNGQLIEMLSNEFLGDGIRGALTFIVAMGTTNVRQFSYIEGISSRNKISNQEFIFQFNPNTESFEKNSWWFSAANNPNEFAVFPLKVKKGKKRRELVTSDIGITAKSAKKRVIEFDFELLSKDRYKITFKQPLEKGEYCFVYKGTTIIEGQTNNSVWDFTVE